ncbi:uncharacterized protein FOMMEDRAFT_161316 [Fomitiporia mediterranea MF3/22]|uniref:uncharacterized protein n=1 Tax=Fomitiporia mediterranea (strain MF3/22) TaxID=694068 RepID=UPI00044088BF|nr:uncharacterized protein FOMMEDRAFT_161316 [Fomitiporia mediterranea MF3/22]EJC99084.1 hypothetical protein FOMMEDRAFT_161316 [Fomitiporia mediterranea MF3/22]
MAPVASTSQSHSHLLPRNTVSNAPRRSPAVLNKSVQLALSHPFLYLCFIVLGGLLSLALVVCFVYCIARYCQRRKRKVHPLLLSPFPTTGLLSSVKSLGSRLNATEKLPLGLIETSPTPTLLFGTISFDRNIAITEFSDTIAEMDITEAVYECGTISCKDGPTNTADVNVGSKDIPPYSRSSSMTVAA